MVFVHQTQLLYTDCNYPRWSVCFTLPNAVFFYFLFNDFYKKSYKKKNMVCEKSNEMCNNNNILAKNYNGTSVAFESKKSL